MKDYLIDFGTMVIQANTEEEAYEKAETLLNSGIVPKIDTIIEDK